MSERIEMSAEASIERRLDDLEQRLTYRLDRHQIALDAARDRLADGRSTFERIVAAGRSSEPPPIVRPPASSKLALPTSAEPEISIVIPVYGAIDDLLACLESIAAFPPRASFEVIVANDATDEAEFAPVRSVGGLVIVDNPQNEGFLATCNRAAAVSRGALLWLLNSDTELTPDAADSLVQTFLDFPDVGAAGSKLVYGDGTLQEAGGIVWRDASAWNYGRGGDARHSEYDYARVADYVSAASLMVRRDVWDELGGFDTAYTPAYYEDTDLCMRIATSNRRVMYQSGSVVVHHEGKSYGTDVSQEGKHHQVVNRETFLGKWERELDARRANGDHPELERERGVQRRVLVIDARMLTPDQDSGSLRMMNLLVALTHAGCRCTFFPHNMAIDEPYAERLRVQGIEVIGAPGHRTVDAFLRARGGEFDAVLMSRLEVAVEHLTSVRRWCPQATVVYDTVDLHFLRLVRAARLADDKRLERAAETTRNDELATVARCDVTLVCSTIEQALIRELAPNARVEVVGNVHMPESDGENDRPGPRARTGMLFVGGFEHPPNVDAVCWFVADILPLIATQEPDVVFHIVGSRMIPQVEALAGPNVVVHGFVADLEPLYRSCRVSVAPLRFGAGVKGKVTQALAVGLPTVGTSVAIEGAPFVPDEHVLVADSADSFADQVLRLLCDDELWQRVSDSALATVQRHFGPDAAVATMADILEFDMLMETR